MSHKEWFAWVWKALHKQGLVPGLDSAEFRLTRDVWLAKGRPYPVRYWILGYLAGDLVNPTALIVPRGVRSPPKA